MSFSPRMTAFVTGISVTDALCTLSLDGIVIDLWRVQSDAGARGRYVSPDPRIVVELDRASLSLSRRPEPVPPAGPVHYVPAGVETYAHCAAAGPIRHLDLHFDSEALRRIVPGGDLSRPRLMQHARRCEALALMLADHCAAPERGDDLALALVAALAIDLLGPPPLPHDAATSAPARGGLTGWQLDRVTGHLRDNLTRRVPVEELAALAGLSPSWFARAFKISTGVPPHRWHMRARIDRAEALLHGGLGPAETAAATGFSDQAHLTRTFRALRGITPAAARRNAAAPRALPQSASNGG
ncbi:AraC family transcriptional regulator [Mesobaculum littorinae]|uniref:AraC family transcriptional regulator n=1 Tax=Mesobaculum littorinae TaxID=2486419 RepID=A0A438AKT2_9RHOB|nr:AraC family transcriptional regulator [Mesobaculum littorinae]RVV99431.1 AraC family transcriptional regulator [Mesobaculum littorinae]